MSLYRNIIVTKPSQARHIAKPSASRQSLRQVAALPYRAGALGGIQVLLVTSRDTGRWVLPKGNIDVGEDERSAALREASEEAGVWGTLSAAAIGTYRYRKRPNSNGAPGVTLGLKDNPRGPRVTVSVWPLLVLNEADDWQEAHQRTRAWFSPLEAAEEVEEPDLRTLLMGFRGQS